MRDIVEISLEEIDDIREKIKCPTGEKIPMCLPSFIHRAVYDYGDVKLVADVEYEWQDGVLNVKVMHEGELRTEFTVLYDWEDFWVYPMSVRFGELKSTVRDEKKSYELLQESYKTFGGIWIVINDYLTHYENGVAVEEKFVKKQSTGNKKKQKKGVSKVSLVKHYTLKREWKREHKRRKHIMTCEAWGVRGHYRHYKSGKVVFIKAFVKGKNRDNYTGKEYRLV